MIEINATDFEQELSKGDKVNLDFYSAECQPSEARAPKVEVMSELFGDKIKFLKIFRQGNRELATRLGVSSSPTLLYFDNGQQSLDAISGGIRKSEIMDRLEQMLTADEDGRTSLPDFFASGDFVRNKFRQSTSTVADGTVAAMSIN